MHLFLAHYFKLFLFNTILFSLLLWRNLSQEIIKSLEIWLRQWAMYHLIHKNCLWQPSNNITVLSPQWRRNFLRVLLVIKELWLVKLNKPKFSWNYNEHLHSSLVTESFKPPCHISFVLLGKPKKTIVAFCSSLKCVTEVKQNSSFLVRDSWCSGWSWG